MQRDRLLKIGLFGISLLIIVMLISSVGWSTFLGTLLSSDPLYVAIGLCCVAVFHAGYPTAVGLGLESRGIDASVWSMLQLSLMTRFFNLVTPFGQMGGEPLSALILSKKMEMAYGDSYAVVFGVDMLRLTPHAGLAVIGLILYTVLYPLSILARFVFGLVALFLLSVLVIIYMIWKHHAGIKTALKRILSLFHVPEPWMDAIIHRLDLEDRPISDRLVEFIENTRELFSDRESMIWIGIATHIEWIAMVLAFFFFLRAVGVYIGFIPLMVVFLFASFSSYLPLPGGLGGFELLITTLLIIFANIPPAPVLAAVVMYRVFLTLIPAAIGGLLVLLSSYRHQQG